MELPYGVSTFKKDTLSYYLCSVLRKSEHAVADKRQKNYFDGYLEYLGAKTVIVEYDYVDRDFLEDYAAYYSRCFQQYDRKCSRLHFFSIEFSEHNFESFFNGTESPLTLQLLQGEGNYLGFIIVNPLPESFFGRTCLRTYPPEHRRYYPITRKYPVNLFGINLTVDSLAYQEQDKAVSACATSALWSVFHGSGILFHHSIPSPVEITKAASHHVFLNQRPFPNSGLTIFQISHATKSVGLEPLLVTVNNDELTLKSHLYTYLKANLPLLLVIDLYEIHNGTEILRGKHAVAVTGFSLGNSSVAKGNSGGFSLEASRIEKIYVHDDQVGPFARMEFDGVTIDSAFRRLLSLSTTYFPCDGQQTIRAVPDCILVPLYHKIRIPYSVIQEVVVSVDGIIESLRKIQVATISGQISWDIYLTTINSLKSEFFTNTAVSSDLRKKVLLRPLPRFMWRATALCEGKAALDLLFDATDIEHAPLLTYAVGYNEELLDCLKAISDVPEFLALLNADEKRISDWFSQWSYDHFWCLKP